MEMDYEHHIVGLGRRVSYPWLVSPAAIKLIEIGHDVSKLEVMSGLRECSSGF